MTAKEGFDFESIIFDYIDEFKFLLFPDQWSSIFLDYSKNEMLALLFLYKNKTANMTEIAEYITAPLNTTTGVVTRLEKKLMVERRRGDEDRRVVNIVLTKTAEEFIDHEKKSIEYYFKEVYKTLTAEEKNAAISIFSKVVTALKKGKHSLNGEDKGVKKVKRIFIE
jgi:MarR family transcriptional regulator, organic hydroperoxide resistance regulator